MCVLLFLVEQFTYIWVMYRSILPIGMHEQKLEPTHYVANIPQVQHYVGVLFECKALKPLQYYVST